MREKRNTVKTNNQELLTRKENESDATSVSNNQEIILNQRKVY